MSCTMTSLEASLKIGLKESEFSYTFPLNNLNVITKQWSDPVLEKQNRIKVYIPCMGTYYLLLSLEVY